ncbi:NADH-quinone oxidoreductase subunit J [Foetidibacter luteolus]|uniref:NADH-quinone oxidoreductase subunit J n=1 Tax=Foetidibacter luteolus TaxID=2608880 RepID=UPI00129B2227|nr:NADH-quinone oxidoreductase subunit J [Foetidibacter luteolus]
MSLLFYISSVVAIVATLLVITCHRPIHALLYLVVSFLAVSMIFLSLGAPFVAVLEVILYAGAIIVLLIFVVMMLNLGQEAALQEKQWLQPKVWVGPSILVAVLLLEMSILLLRGESAAIQPAVDMKRISLVLFKEYVIAVELVGFLLMAGIVGAAHIGKHKKKHPHRFLQNGKENGHADNNENNKEVKPGELLKEEMIHN